MNNLDYRQEDNTLVIVPHGSLNVEMVESFWDQTMKKLKGLNPLRILVDGSDVSTCQQASAQLEISLYLLRKKGNEKILLGKNYTAREPMDSSKAEDYFETLEIALTKILQQYEKELATLLN